MAYLAFSPSTSNGTGSPQASEALAIDPDNSYDVWSTLTAAVNNDDTVIFMDSSYDCNTSTGTGQLTLPEKTGVTYTRASALSSNPVLDGTAANAPNNIIFAGGNCTDCTIDKLDVTRGLHNGILVESTSATAYSSGLKITNCTAYNNGRTLADPVFQQGQGIMLWQGHNWASGPASATDITGIEVSDCTTYDNASMGVLIDGPYLSPKILRCTSTGDGKGSDGYGANTVASGLVCRPTGGASTTFSRARSSVNQTTLNGAVADDASTVTVTTVAGIQIADVIAIQTGSASSIWHWTVITAISGSVLTLANNMSAAADDLNNVITFSTVYETTASNYDYRELTRCSMSNCNPIGFTAGAATDIQHVFSEDTTNPTLPVPGKFGSVPAAATKYYVNMGMLFNDYHDTRPPLRMTLNVDGDMTTPLIDGCTASGAQSSDGHGMLFDQHTVNGTMQNCVSFGNAGHGFRFHISLGGTVSNCQAYGNGDGDIGADKLKDALTVNTRSGPVITAEEL